MKLNLVLYVLLSLYSPLCLAAEKCEDFLSSLPGFQGNYIEVPENWDQPSTSPKLKVFYYVRKAELAPDRAPTVIFFNGGPGEDSHSAAQDLSAMEFSKRVNFVFMDQRGTGCSTPYPNIFSQENAKRLMSWGSRGIVGDAEAVRKALGAKKWRAYGQSYGGLIVHRYLEIAPSGLERAISHGSSVMKDPVDWYVERIRSQKRISDQYFDEYPRDRSRLATLKAAIPATQCWTTEKNKICGAKVLDALTYHLGFKTSWPAINTWLTRFEQIGGINQEAINEFVQNIVFGVFVSDSLAGSVLGKLEIVPGEDDHSSCQKVLERMEALGENPMAYEFNECRMLAGVESSQYDLMKNVVAYPIHLERIISNLKQPDAPSFYLFSGQLDVFTPYKTFEEEVATLGKHVIYQSFPNSGHEGFSSEVDVTDAVSR